jgi:hypothetical protein
MVGMPELGAGIGALTAVGAAGVFWYAQKMLDLRSDYLVGTYPECAAVVASAAVSARVCACVRLQNERASMKRFARFISCI